MNNDLINEIKNYVREDHSARKPLGEAFSVIREHESDEKILDFLLEFIRLEYEEVNDLSKLEDSLKEEDIPAAIRLIEKYANTGHDHKCKQFILYIHCLFKLCLGEFKETTNRKELCREIVSQLENIDLTPVDILSPEWNSSLYPENLLAAISMQLMELGVDFSALWKTRSQDEIDRVFLELASKLANGNLPEEALKLTTHIRGRNIDKAYAEISESFARKGEGEVAFSIISKMRFEDDIHHPKYHSYIKVYSLFKEQGHSNYAENALNLAIKEAYQLNDEHQRYVLTGDIACLVVADEMTKRAISLINGLQKARPFNERLEGFFSKRKSGNYEAEKYNMWKTEAYLSVFRKFDSTNAMGNGDVFLRKAMRESRKIRDRYFKNESLKLVILALCEKGRLNEAFRIIDKINDESARNEAFKIAAVHLTFPDQYDMAMDILSKINDDREKCMAMIEVANRMIMAGLNAESFELLEEAVGLAKTFNMRKQDDIVSEAISPLLAGVYNSTKSFPELLLQITDRYTIDEILEDASMELIKLGKYQMALTAAESIDDLRKRALVLSNLFSKSAKAGESGIADASKSKLMELLNLLPDGYDKDSIYAKEAILLAEEGKEQEAFLVALNIKEFDKKIKSINNIADILAAENKTSYAILLMEYIAVFHPVPVRYDWGIVEILFGLSMLLSEENKPVEAHMALKSAIDDANKFPFFYDENRKEIYSLIGEETGITVPEILKTSDAKPENINKSARKEENKRELIQRCRKAATEFRENYSQSRINIFDTKGERGHILEFLEKTALYCTFAGDDPKPKIVQSISNVLDISYLFDNSNNNHA